MTFLKKNLFTIIFSLISISCFSQPKRDWEKSSLFDSQLVFEGTLLAKRDYFREFEGNKICYENFFFLVNRVINGDSLFTDHVV